MERYHVRLTCPYCERDTSIDLTAAQGIIRRQHWCPHCGHYQELTITFDAGRITSVVTSRAIEPGTTLN